MGRHELPLKSMLDYDREDGVIQNLWKQICDLESLAKKRALELFREDCPDRDPYGKKALPDDRRALRRLEFEQLMAAADEINELWAQISERACWTIYRRGIDYKMGQRFQIELDGKFRSVTIKRLSFGYVEVARPSLKTHTVCLEDLLDQSELSMEYTPMASAVPQDPEQQLGLFAA